MANDCVNVGYQMFFGKGAKLFVQTSEFYYLILLFSLNIIDFFSGRLYE